MGADNFILLPSCRLIAFRSTIIDLYVDVPLRQIQILASDTVNKILHGHGLQFGQFFRYLANYGKRHIHRIYLSIQ